MRDQYAGDISDLLKFAFLRALAGADRTLGIAWYYAPGDDGRADGRHLEWRGEAAWHQLDSELHAALSVLPKRSIQALERAAIWPLGVQFHREPMPRTAERSAWANRKRAALDGADLVFLDPDNGLSDKTSTKHATFAEVGLLRRPGRTVVFITFPGRTAPHDVLLKRIHARLKKEAHADTALTLRSSVMVKGVSGRAVPRLRWFTLVDPDATLIQRARDFARMLSAMPGVRARLE